MTKNLALFDYDDLDDLTTDDGSDVSVRREIGGVRRRDDRKRTVQAKRRAKLLARDYIPSIPDDDTEDE